MANALKGERGVTLKDGRRLTLVFDMEALIAAEALYGKPMAMVLADAQKGFVGATRALIFGATRPHHAELTPGEVAEFIATDGKALAQALGDAHAAAMPEPAKGTEGKGREAKPRAGKRSGGSGAKPG